MNKPTTSYGDRIQASSSSQTIESRKFQKFVTKEALLELSYIFPHVSATDLTTLLEKCKGDKEMAAELLTDPSFTFQQFHQTGANNAVHNSEILNCSNDEDVTNELRKGSGRSNQSGAMKKEIEDFIQIGNEHYSDDARLMKRLHRREIGADDVLVSDEFSSSPSPKTFPMNESLPPLPDCHNDEPMMPMCFDPSFFKSLVTRFGQYSGAKGGDYKDYRPVIKIPESFARQLYWLWVETVNQQVEEIHMDYEQMLREDERLAIVLQGLESKEALQEMVERNFPELIPSVNEENVMEKPDDSYAFKLNRQLLFEAYPHLDREVLLEVFRSEGLSLQSTLTILSEQYGPPIRIGHDCEPLKTTVREQEYLRNPTATSRGFQVSAESSSRDLKPAAITKTQENASRSPNFQQDILIVDPSEFRWEIQILHKCRSDYIKSGKKAMEKNDHTSAANFFKLASEIKEQIHAANQNFTSRSLFSNGSSVSTTIDLHYLFTAEAVQVVDLFLDHHIADLQTKSLTLELITGRGQHSQGRNPRIKPEVEKRLEERELRYYEENPGMLCVIVGPDDLLSYEV